MFVMRSWDDVPVPAVFYERCPQHPRVLLPVPEREAERVFCWECVQSARRLTYAKQKAGIACA